MKIHELFEEQISKEQAIQLVYAYTNEYNRQPGLDQAVTFLMQDGSLTYNGKMYRAIFFDAEDLIKMPDLRLLSTKVQQFAHQHDNINFSWSKSINGMNVAIDINVDAGVYEDIAEYTYGVVFEQSGTSLDITSVLGEDKVVDVEEQELLATNQNMHIVGFHFGEMYNVSQFQEMIADIKAEFE